MSKQILQVFHGILLVLLFSTVCIAQTTDAITAIVTPSGKQPSEAHYASHYLFTFFLYYV